MLTVSGTSGAQAASTQKTLQTAPYNRIGILFQIPNLPDVPNLTSPISNVLVKNYSPTLVWSQTNVPVGSTFDHYQVQLATDTYFMFVLQDASITDVNTPNYTATPNLDSNLKIFWRVRVCDTLLKCSLWSNVGNFRTAIRPPNLITPINEAQTTDRLPLFDWNNIEGASSYTIHISNNPAFAPILMNKTVISSNFTPIFNLPLGTLYWRVRANGVNGPSSWSVKRSIIEEPYVGNIYYVSTTGNDGNPGAQDSPWATIQKAANTMVAGDTALVQPGNYSERVNISNSEITLQAEGNISGNLNTIRGFTITDPTCDWGIQTTGDNNLIENNEIHHTHQDGIRFFGSYNTFRGNYIHDILANDTIVTHSDCFQTWSWDWDVHDVLFENNTCINNETVNSNNEFAYISRDKTRLKPNGETAEIRDITFRNNILVIYRPIYAGFGLGDVSNITIENNTIVNMSQGGDNTAAIEANMTGFSFINNLCINWGNQNRPYWKPYVVANTGKINHNAIYNNNGIPPKFMGYPNDLWMIDPKIVSFPGLDFHLRPGSPLCTAGTNGTYIGAYPCQ
jgi:hypothetical protein